MNKSTLDTIDIWSLKPGDVLKSYKSLGMKRYESDAKSYIAFEEDTPIFNIYGFRVERSFNTNIVRGQDSRYLRLQKGEEGTKNFQDIHFIFPLDTKVKCWKYINDIEK